MRRQPLVKTYKEGQEEKSFWFSRESLLFLLTSC